LRGFSFLHIYLDCVW